MPSPRARDLGIRIGEGTPGPFNAITDVAGVRVGHTTLISGDGPLVVGQGPVRTGVTVLVPHDGDVWAEPLFAERWHRAASHVADNWPVIASNVWSNACTCWTSPLTNAASALMASPTVSIATVTPNATSCPTTNALSTAIEPSA